MKIYSQLDSLQLGHFTLKLLKNPLPKSPPLKPVVRSFCVLIPLLSKVATVIWPNTKPVIFELETSSLHFLHLNDIKIFPMLCFSMI